MEARHFHVGAWVLEKVLKPDVELDCRKVSIRPGTIGPEVSLYGQL